MNAAATYHNQAGDTMPPVGVLKWQLRKFLQEHNLSAYALAKELDSVSRAPTIYRLAREDVELHKLDLAVTASILDGLRSLTGKDVNVQDLLEYQDDDR